ncbi:uncharacterized protein LOC123307933 [Coccinella septempunctata]|uniref:uncharacterized protein LOC123307933 n=1 Tax=Coccinella septempunctata TaxID=41139 RepID=UPI001D076CF5|nr:uncharacterized protein LOC123307933 [Coccinella septempunctata]
MRIFFENSSILAEKVKAALEGNDINLAVSLLEDTQNYAAVKTGSSELVPVIAKYVCSEYESENSDLFTACSKLLEKVVEVALVEDILVQLLELVEISDSTNLSIILTNVFKVLRRAPREKTKLLGWSVNSIQVRLNKCTIPEYGVTSVRSDNDVFYIEILYQDVLHFYDLIIPFYSEYFLTNEEYRLILIKYLIQLLAKPMGYLDLGPHNEKTKLRKMAENIVRKILSICNDPFTYLSMDEEDSLNPTIFAYGMFLHFLLDENTDYALIPRVYTSTYIFRASLIYITKLLKSYSNLVILKGFCTLEMLFNRTPKLSHLILEIEANEGLCEVMEKIVVYNQYQEMRQRALDVFKLYLHKFVPKGQYLLLTNLIFKIQHSGLSGYMITQYKEILFEMQQKQHPEVSNFEGDKMYIFIKKCYGTIDSEGAFQYDKIVSLLNLMRFAVVQVKTEDCEKFRRVSNAWREQFFNRLESSLEKLKRVIRQKIFNVENDSPEPNFEFSLHFEDAEDIDSLSKPKKLESLQSSLTEIEMTESLLKRVIELLEEKNC